MVTTWSALIVDDEPGVRQSVRLCLRADREVARQQAVTITHDRTALNILLERRPDEPLQLYKLIATSILRALKRPWMR